MKEFVSIFSIKAWKLNLSVNSSAIPNKTSKKLSTNNMMRKITDKICSSVLIGVLMVFLTSSCTKSDRLPDPKIMAGMAKISGRITNFQQKPGEKQAINLTVNNVITVDDSNFKSIISGDGSFQFEFPIESSPTLVAIYTTMFGSKCIYIPVTSCEVTKVEITCEEKGKEMSMTLSDSLNFTTKDLLNSSNMIENFYRNVDDGSFYDLKPDDFSHIALDSLLPNRISRSLDISILSECAKSFVTKECRFVFLVGILLNYDEYIDNNYRSFGPKNENKIFCRQPTNRSYYQLLKQFDLNSSQNLYHGLYAMVFQRLLKNDFLRIPPIKDTPIDEWLKVVKLNLKDLVGFDSGLFYDMLVANAYSRQFSINHIPLSKIQKENVRYYFNNTGISDVLIRKSDEIAKQNDDISFLKTVVNPTPPVPKKELLNSIVSKYKGKVVLIDFWATWCGPCMDAMNDIKDIKKQMKGRDIVYVYITSVSSPKKIWEQKVPIIRGEHYYLTQEDWEYIMESFGFSGIPTYLLYNSKGELKNQVTGYPGTDNMRQMIEKVLK